MSRKDKLTISMPFNEFYALWNTENAYKDITAAISGCFEYAAEETETLTVDIERLVAVCKQYALYGKDVDSNVENMVVVVKRGQSE